MSSDGCGCEYSYTCEMHSNIYELQAKDYKHEEKITLLQEQIDALVQRVERLESPGLYR